MIYKLIKRTHCSCAGADRTWNDRSLGQYAFDVSDHPERINDSNGDVIFISHCTVSTKHPCNCKYCYHFEYERKPKCKGSVDRWRGFSLVNIPNGRKDYESFTFDAWQDICDLIQTLCVPVDYGEGSRSGPYVIARDLVRWMHDNGIKKPKLGPIPDAWKLRMKREAAFWLHLANAYAELKLKKNRLHSEALREDKQREKEKQCQQRNELSRGTQLLRQSRQLARTLDLRGSQKMASPQRESLTI